MPAYYVSFKKHETFATGLWRWYLSLVLILYTAEFEIFLGYLQSKTSFLPARTLVSLQLETPFYLTHLLAKSDGETGNTYRILLGNTNTETALRQRPIVSYPLKRWEPNFGTDVAAVVISSIQKYPLFVWIKEIQQVLRRFYVVYFPSDRPGNLCLPLVS
jgi:hypothetical protein